MILLVRFEPGIIGFHFKKGLETPFSYLELSHSGRKNDLGSSYESTDQYEGMTHGMTHHNDSFTTMNQRRISLEQKARDRRIEIKPANQRPSSEKTIPDGYYAVSIKTSPWKEYVFGWMSHPTCVISLSPQAK